MSNMKYFIATEFLEGPQKKLVGYTKPTIDLISIGIKCEDGREYYAISKDFNLKEAWNRYDIKTMTSLKGDSDSNKMKVYWIRDNVLKPIFIELRAKEVEEYNIAKRRNVVLDFPEYSFCFREFKRLINKYGKTNKQIAEEVVKFTKPVQNIDKNILDHIQTPEQFKIDYSKPQFYGYYCDYGWVVFCWLFGKMIDLPTGFPKYCINLKQILDEQEDIRVNTPGRVCGLKGHPNYPKQTNAHNSLNDARFNYELYKFLKTL